MPAKKKTVTPPAPQPPVISPEQVSRIQEVISLKFAHAAGMAYVHNICQRSSDPVLAAKNFNTYWTQTLYRAVGSVEPHLQALFHNEISRIEHEVMLPFMGAPAARVNEPVKEEPAPVVAKKRGRKS